MSEPIENPRYRGLVIRKNAKDLSDWIDRARFMYKGMGATVAYQPPIITFPSGSQIRTGHLKDENAYTNYQGHEYDRILIEELTQIPDEKRYIMLKASNRSTHSGLKPQMFLTANPGGVGHAWVKKRFIKYSDKEIRYKPYEIYTDQYGLNRIYVPAAVEDNPALMTADPMYVRQLDALKDTDYDLWKAWRRGDWSIIAGQAFREWNPLIHINNVPPFPLRDCKKFIGFDWGYSNWGVALWIAITPENQFGVQRYYVYRELWMQHQDPRQWAKQFKMLQNLDGVRDIWLPHDCFNKEMGASIADIFQREGKMNIKPAGTLQKGARHMRKAILHSILADAIDGRPYLTMHSNCSMLADSIPELITDDNDPEDIDTESNDHGYDALTEALMMEAPHLGNSGGVSMSTPIPNLNTVRGWKPSIVYPGTYLPDDIMGAVAQYNMRPSGRMRAR